MKITAVVIGGGLMYLAAAHLNAAGAVIAAPRSAYRPALIVVRHNTGDGDFDAMMRQQMAQMQAQMEAGMRDMQRSFNQMPAQSWSEHHSTTRRQVFRGRSYDDDDGDDTEVRPYQPPAPRPVMPSPTEAASPDDNSASWWDVICGVFAIGALIGIAKGCINFARKLSGFGAVTKAPVFSPPPYQPAWPYQPPSPAQPVWPAKPAGPVFYDIPE